MNNSKQFDLVTTSLPRGAAFPVGGLVSSGVELEKAAPLGIYANLRTPPLKSGEFFDSSTGEIVTVGKLNSSESINLADKMRMTLQDSARDILYMFHGDNTPLNKDNYPIYHRTCSCTRIRMSPTVQLCLSKNKNVYFKGLKTCASASTCPVCAASINERKANDMRLMANQSAAMGHKMSLLTLTTPHTSSDKIEDLLPKITEALACFWRGAWATRFKKKYGIIGNVRSFEVLHGSNGWHPHFHLVVVSNDKLPSTNRSDKGFALDNQSDDWLHILKRWQNVSIKCGLGMPNFNGLDIQNGDKAGEYITKFGSDEQILETKSGKKITWDMMDEATKGMTKIGKKGSRTPWGLLADSADTTLPKEFRQQSKFLFLFYARAIKGKSLLRWSKGLRDHFDLGKELTDEEILNNPQDELESLSHILPIEWEKILKLKQRHVPKALIRSGGGVEAVARYLFSIDDFADDFDVFYSGFLSRGIVRDDFEDDLSSDENKVILAPVSDVPLVINNDLNYLNYVADDIYSIINPKHTQGFFKKLFLENNLFEKKRPFVEHDQYLNI